MSMSRWAQSSSHLDRRHGPAFTAAGDGMEGNYSAVLHSAPSGGTVDVIIPAIGLTTVFTANISAGFTGSVKDRVLVAFDEEKQPWVLSPSALTPPPATTLASLGVARGASSVTFAASVVSGIVTVTHGLGSTPTSLVVTAAPGSAAAVWFIVTAMGATTFSAQGQFPSSLSGTVNFTWVAII